MDRRSLRLATAGGFLAGVGLFVAGALIAFTVSWPIGATMFAVGGALTGASRLIGWKLKLPAP